MKTEKLQDILKGLCLWKDMFGFLAIARLRDDDTATITAKAKHTRVSDYVAMTSKFKSDVKQFYEVGARTFLSR